MCEACLGREYFAMTREVERSRSYGVFANARRIRVALNLGEIATIEMCSDQEEVSRDAMPNKENEDPEPRPSLPAEAGGKDRRQREHIMVAIAGPPGCGTSSVARKLQRKLQSEGVPCVVVHQDNFLAMTRGNCKLCGQTKCNYNVLNEQGLADRI